MSQLLGLVTQMHGNIAVININYSTDVWTTERWVAGADTQNILELSMTVDICALLLFLLIIFSLLMTRSARGITLMRRKWLDKLKEI